MSTSGNVTKVMAFGALMLVVLAGMLTLLSVSVGHHTQFTALEPQVRPVVGTFEDDVAAGRWTEAAEAMCSGAPSAGELATALADLGVTGADPLSTTVFEASADTASVWRPVHIGEQLHRVQYQVVREGDRWKVCGVSTAPSRCVKHLRPRQPTARPLRSDCPDDGPRVTLVGARR